MGASLTPKQLLFAQGIAAGKTQRQAAIDAGSTQPDVLGSRWLKMVKVKEHIALLTKDATRALERKANGQRRDLTRALEMLWEEAEETRPAEFSKDAEGQVKYQRFKPQAARMALLEFYQPKGDQPGSVTNVLNVLSPALAAQVYKALVSGSNGNGHHEEPA